MGGRGPSRAACVAGACPLLAAALLLARPAEGGAQLTRFPWLAPADSAGARLVPFTLHAALRTAWTDDRENGALWAGKGVSSLLRGGVAYRQGPLRVVLAPEVTWASNGRFPLANAPGPARDGTTFKPYASPWQAMDLVRRWGEGAAYEFHAGQSLVEVRGGGFALGATAANLVRGPEARYPLIVGSSGPGVPSGYLDGGGRAGPLGRMGFRLQYGLLRESPWFDDDPDNDRLLLTLLGLDWEPAFLPGISLGLTAIYRDPVEDGVTPFMLFQPFKTRSAQTDDQLAEDAMAAAHARWVTPAATFWGTWARGDGALNVEDLLTEPDHTQMWAVGSRVRWGEGDAAWELVGEAASSTGMRVRAGSDYRHSRARTGHTHRGQMLGASVGPGARAQWVQLRRSAEPAGTVGVEVERILRDLDAYARTLRRPDGASGEDREWRLAALYEGPVPAFAGGLARVPGLSVRANGGVSLRWNRDYVRYSANADQVGPRESQLFLDLALTWDPRTR